MNNRDITSQNQALVAGAGARLSILGCFELTWQGRVVPFPRTAQRLLAFLSFQTRPMQRNLVASLLWPDTTESRAGANLRTAIWQARRYRCPTVEISGRELRLSEDLSTDVQEFVAWARRVIAYTATTADLDSHSPAFFGELLPGVYDDWVLAEREQLRQLRLHALDVLCESLSLTGRTPLAIEVGLTAVALEPLRESSQRALIAAYLTEGNRSEAFRQYQSFRKLLLAELRATPSERMESLMQRPFPPAPGPTLVHRSESASSG